MQIRQAFIMTGFVALLADPWATAAQAQAGGAPAGGRQAPPAGVPGRGGLGGGAMEATATKVGRTVPGEMYVIGAHMDGRGGGEAANDDGSGTALVMELARVFGSPAIQTTRSLRFALWNNEETGLNGARAYVQQRAPLQGLENPKGSGTYPEPKWLRMIQHDMMMWDHGLPVQWQQTLDADVDIEFQLNSAKAA